MQLANEFGNVGRWRVIGISKYDLPEKTPFHVVYIINTHSLAP